MQRDKFVLPRPVAQPSRKKFTSRNPEASEGKSSRQEDGAPDDAKKNDVDQQIGNVIFLVEVGVLVPGDAGVIVHRTQKHLGIAGGKWPGCNGDNRSGPFSEEWTDILDCGYAGLRSGRYVGDDDAPQVS